VLVAEREGGERSTERDRVGELRAGGALVVMMVLSSSLEEERTEAMSKGMASGDDVDGVTRCRHRVTQLRHRVAYGLASCFVRVLCGCRHRVAPSAPSCPII
jgi:hypothetical protein